MKYPALQRWYEAMDNRPAYAGIKSDYYTHCHDLPPQIGFCHSTDSAKTYKDAIDGGDWSVAKSPEDVFEPMLPLPVSESAAKREVGRTICGQVHIRSQEYIESTKSHHYLAVFACRAVAKRKGMNWLSVGAPLSDPNASTDDAWVPLVDSVLRNIVHGMVGGKSRIAQPSPLHPAVVPLVRESLEYLRDRIGVPRDLSVHGAKQLRSHLNLFIQSC